MLGRCGQRRRERDSHSKRPDEHAASRAPWKTSATALGRRAAHLRAELDCRQQPRSTAHLGDQLVPGEWLQRLASSPSSSCPRATGPPAPAGQGLRAQRRRRSRDRRRLRPGGTCPAGAVPERIGDPLGDDRAAERQVAAGHALGEHDHVGLDIPALDPEPRSRACQSRRSRRRPRAAHRSGGRCRRPPRCSPRLGGWTPPAPITGSMKKAATLSAPRRSIVCSRSSAESWATGAVSDSSSPKPSRLGSMPPIEVPKPCVPWYACSRG